MNMPLAISEFGRVESQGVNRVDRTDLTGLMQIQNWQYVGGGLNIDQLATPMRCIGGRPNKGTKATVPPALALKPHSSVAPHMSPMPP